MQKTAASDKSKIIISLCILCLLAAIVFYPSLRNGFTNCDDPDYVTRNPSITELSWKNIKTIFTTTSVFYIYHPLVLLSYAVEHHFFGLDPFPYHLTNLILHISNTLLVFYLIFLLSRNCGAAFFTALLFAVHPLRVESVAWVTERKDVLYAFFFLAGLVAYIYYQRNRRPLAYFISLLLFVLSLLSKPMAVTLPAVLLLLDYVNGRKIGLSELKEKAPFFALSIVFSVINMSSHYPADEARVEAGFTMIHKVLNGFHGILFHVGKLLAPVNLCCLYQHPINFVNEIPLSYYLSPVVVIVMLAAVLFSARYSRKGVFGFLFFLVTILPVLQFLPVGGKSTPADRFTYVPAVGLFYAAGAFFYWLGWERFKRTKWVKTSLIACFALAVTAMSAETFLMCGVWKDSVTLWTNVLRYYPDNLVAFSNRGAAYLEQGKTAEAIADFSEALKKDPDYIVVLNNRGNVFNTTGEFEKAVGDYTRAIKLQPKFAPAYYNRGNAYAALKRFDMAIEDYTSAVALKPDYAEAYHNRGSAHNDNGETNKAISDYTEAIRINPNYDQAYFNRGNVLFKQERYGSAISDYYHAIKLNPRHAGAYFNRAVAYYMTGEFEMAWLDVTKLEHMGYQVDPEFLRKLQEADDRGR